MNTQFSSQEVTELAKALIAVQRDLRPAAKDSNNPFTKSRYASLNSVMEACRDILLSHGIWLTQLPVPSPVELGPGHIALLTKLTHAESGQWQSSLAVVPLPKSDPQGMGSAITYARRYALTAMLGMVTEDDDGEGAKSGQKSVIRSKRAVNCPQMQKAPLHEQTGQDEFRDGVHPSAHLEDLPQLDGVSYHYTVTQDGRQCIVATGNTHNRKEILSGAGFLWNSRRQCWWKYADVA